MIRNIGIADRETLEQNLKRLKLRHIRDKLDEINELALQEEPSYLDFLAHLVQEEVDGREATSRQRRLKAARFPACRTLDSFDFTFQTSVSQQTIRDLATLEFIKARENLILLGPPGVGNYVKKVVMQSHEPESNARRSLTDSMTLHNETGSFTQVIEPGHQVFVVIPFRIPSMIV